MIREAVIGDANYLADLMKTLGYPSTEDEMRQRLEVILNHEDFKTFVYESSEGVIGMIGMSFSYAYHTDSPHVRVIAFVVDGNHQEQGIGRLLMNEAEHWAEGKGAKTIQLNSGNRKEREITHKIYEGFGFVGKATGFYKKL
ncbi:GNAT family N-acetyltransferase [Halobacillus halophilus]|uniref:GNAT family N-acetyltransferase n=1 Tax=Halobacillus halophilus TaxID=1570 RepID=UPI001CD57258|nr:GNAT family N-acetyltransferase [Halobacillus halophilus]MCA1010185.1 GNAT family N-acetyltransferase [Halobacillus halophilus]